MNEANAVETLEGLLSGTDTGALRTALEARYNAASAAGDWATVAQYTEWLEELESR